MKNFCIISLILLGSYFNSQTLVLNDKLLLQLTKNQTVRLASNESFLKSFEKQRKAYDDINNKITQAIAIQEYIYQQLVNVNYAIKQGKQLIYVYNYFGEIAQNLEELRKLTTKNLQYAPLLGRYYYHIAEECLKLKKEVADEIMKEDNDFLMDPYDRQILLNKILDRAREINGTILYINLVLKNAKKTPYIYQVPWLNNYVNLDKVIINDIIQKYQVLKY